MLERRSCGGNFVFFAAVRLLTAAPAPSERERYELQRDRDLLTRLRRERLDGLFVSVELRAERVFAGYREAPERREALTISSFTVTSDDRARVRNVDVDPRCRCSRLVVGRADFAPLLCRRTLPALDGLMQLVALSIRRVHERKPEAP